MLSDRDYMDPRRGRGGPPGFSAGGAGCVFILIGINLVVFLLQGTTLVPLGEYVLTFNGLKHLQLWRLITYMFLHGGFGHLFFNMWGLYMFGTVVAPRMGAGRFLALYFISGVTGGLFFFVFNWGNAMILLLGASGAVFGVTLAAAMLEPNMQVLLLIPPVPMKMKTLAIVFIILEFFFQVAGFEKGVAHLAHLGGILAAYIFLKALYGKNVWDPLSLLFGSSSGHGSHHGGAAPPPPRGWTITSFPDTSVSQEELDRILDKISSSGINSLSENEMQTLRKAREEMKNR